MNKERFDKKLNTQYSGLSDDFLWWEKDMQKFDTSPFYWLGNAIGILAALLNNPNNPTVKKSDIIVYANRAREFLQFFINQKVIPISTDSANLILNNLNKIINPKGVFPVDIISQEEKDLLFQSIYNFQAVLSSELPQKNIFYASQKRAYDMTILINNGEGVLSQETRNFLDSSKSKVIYDIREAAKCIAFNIPTATGFHIYRAIESIIVDDYFPVLNVLPTEYNDNQNLGNYIRILINKGVDVKITEMLKHLKDYYRNPVLHPKEIWDFDKAESAFGFANSAITILVQDIHERKVI